MRCVLFDCLFGLFCFVLFCSVLFLFLLFLFFVLFLFLFCFVLFCFVLFCFEWLRMKCFINSVWCILRSTSFANKFKSTMWMHKLYCICNKSIFMKSISERLIIKIMYSLVFHERNFGQNDFFTYIQLCILNKQAVKRFLNEWEYPKFNLVYNFTRCCVFFISPDMKKDKEKSLLETQFAFKVLIAVDNTL